MTDYTIAALIGHGLAVPSAISPSGTEGGGREGRGGGLTAAAS